MIEQHLNSSRNTQTFYFTADKNYIFPHLNQPSNISHNKPEKEKFQNE
jgi:hypothetical protein